MDRKIEVKCECEGTATDQLLDIAGNKSGITSTFFKR
jgi:hypothetical protein